jgi:hypothetical protein
MNPNRPFNSSSSRDGSRSRRASNAAPYVPPATPPFSFQSGWLAPPQPVTFPQGYSGQFWTPNYQAYGFPPPPPPQPPSYQPYGQMNSPYGFTQGLRGGDGIYQGGGWNLQHTYQFGNYQNTYQNTMANSGMPPPQPPQQPLPRSSSRTSNRHADLKQYAGQETTNNPYNQVGEPPGLGVVAIKQGKKKKAKSKGLKAQAQAQTQTQNQKKSRSRDPKIHLPAPLPPPHYFRIALGPCYVIEPPLKCLIVLDLNGTLIYRPSRKRPTHLIARPYLKPFLRFLFENFSVMVWSSARPENVKAIVDNVLDEELRSMLVARWARNTFGLTTAHYSMNVQVYKDLTKIWNCEEIQMKHPHYHSGDRFGQNNTILLDDSKIKADAQPHNLLEIPEFEATPEQMKSDILREVAGYLQTARMQNNVSSFIRQNPFKGDGRWRYDWPDEVAAESETKGGEVEVPAGLAEEDRPSSQAQESFDDEDEPSLQSQGEEDPPSQQGQAQAQWTTVN